MTEPTGLRADAERNRQRIVDAACELFAEVGIDVPLEDVARHAGVGIATLYRRFPTRAELTAAAFVQKMQAYVDVVDRAIAEDDPWGGIVGLVEGLCGLQASDAGLRDLLTMSFPEAPAIEELMGRAQDRVESLLRRAREAGKLRADVVAEDFGLIALGNAGVVVRTHEQLPDAWRRYAALALEALRARPDAVALPKPPSPGELRAAVMR